MSKHMAVKTIFYSIQGEGFWVGYPMIFIRFSSCNLWNGKGDLHKRGNAVCQICDTDFIGVDGPNGGVYDDVALLNKIKELYPRCKKVVLTGGEPMLQVKHSFVELLKKHDYFVAIETNGTKPVHDNIDWITCSPKSLDLLVLTQCSELKVVYPVFDPCMFERAIKSNFKYVQPFYSDTQANTTENIRQTIEFCKLFPDWRLSLQTQKLIGID